MLNIRSGLRRAFSLAAIAALALLPIASSVADGPSGHIPGPRGMTGAAGTNGINGSTWYSGSGAPGSGIGVNGDFYYRNDTLQIYGKSAGAWSSVGGPMVSLAGKNVYTGKQVWKGIAEALASPAPVITGGTLTIDLNAGNLFDVAANAAITTFTVINAEPGYGNSFTLWLTGNGTSYALPAWGASVKWDGGVVPTPPSIAGKIGEYSFVSKDGGTTWLGHVGGASF